MAKYNQIEPGNLVKVSVLSTKLNITLNHITKLTAKLVKLGYIKSVRGPDGGLAILPQVFQVSIYEIIINFESDFNLIDCNKPNCIFKHSCKLAALILTAKESFLSILKSKNFADIINENYTIIKPKDILNVKQKVHKNIKFTRENDKTTYIFSPCEPIDGAPSWKYIKTKLWVTKLNTRWVCINQDHAIQAIPWSIAHLDNSKNTTPPNRSLD